MTRAKNHRGGFAMVLAITLLGVAAISVAALAAAFARDSQRTWTQGEDAQLRQMLLAGAEFARQKAAELPASVALPAELKERGAALNLKWEADKAGGERVVEITASLPKHQLGERIRLSGTGGNWRIIGAELGN